MLDCLVWSAVALIVQIVVYYLVKIPVPNLSQRIAEGQMAPAIWLGLSSLAAGALNAASMIYLMTTGKRLTEFGKREPAPLPPAPGPKRSNHVALLVMGTLAVGGGAYAFMPRETCQPAPPPSPGMAAPAVPNKDRLHDAHLLRQRWQRRRQPLVALQFLRRRFIRGSSSTTVSSVEQRHPRRLRLVCAWVRLWRRLVERI